MGSELSEYLESLQNTPEIIEKKTKFEELNEQLVSSQDIELDSEKPSPTYYDSQIGLIEIQGQIYFDGDIGPDGELVEAPILGIKEWAYKYEEFPQKIMIQNPRNRKYYQKEIMRPAEINDLEVRFHEEMMVHDRILLLAFRGARKSTAGMRFGKKAVLDKGVTLAYFSSSASLVTDYSEEIKSQFTYNKRILKDYGYIIDEKKTKRKDQMYWMKQRRSAAREPGLAVGSSPGSGKGKSRIGGHPNILIIDDPIGEEQEGSALLRKKVARWFWKQVWPMLTSDTQLIIIGTMKHPQDLYNEIIEKEIMEVIKIRAIEEWPNNGQTEAFYEVKEGKWYYTRFKKPSERKAKIRGVAGIVGGRAGFDGYFESHWNDPGRVQYFLDDDSSLGIDRNRMALQEFLIKRHEVSPVNFEYEYQLNAIPVEAGYLAWDRMTSFDYEDEGIPSKEELHFNCQAFFDQSFGQSNRADYCAIAIVSRVEDEMEINHYYLLDLKVWRGGGVGKKEQMMAALAEKHPYVEHWGIEADVINSADAIYLKQHLPELDIIPVYQRAKKNDEEEGVERTKVVYKLPDDIKSNKRAKIIRILNQLDVPMSMGRIHLYKGIDPEDMVKFNACRNFPKCEKFDPLDAKGSAMEMCDNNQSFKDCFWDHNN
jgi:hypothetical protein